MNLEIENKVVAITGASSGIGKAISLLLAKNGAKVVLGARRADQLEKIAKQIKDTGGESVYAVTDVRDPNGGPVVLFSICQWCPKGSFTVPWR